MKGYQGQSQIFPDTLMTVAATESSIMPRLLKSMALATGKNNPTEITFGL